jgi:predicted dehydrogenase
MHNVCVVGCGSIAQLHAKNLKSLAQLYFHSRTPASAEYLQAQCGGQGVIATFGEVIDRKDIDALLICSPPEHHTEQISSALEAGKCVLVEKPMCATPAEVAHLEETVQAYPDCFLMVAENYYYKPSLMIIKDLIDQGYIGELKAVKVQKHTAQVTSGWKNAYGALLEGGIHFVALISALFDAAPVQVTAKFPGHQKGESERNSILKLEYETGASAELSYAWNKPSLTKGIFQHSHIKGAQGTIIFESNGLYIRLKSPQKRKTYFPGTNDLMGYKAMTKDFIACLDDRSHSRSPYSDFNKAKRDLNIVFNAYKNL